MDPASSRILPTVRCQSKSALLARCGAPLLVPLLEIEDPLAWIYGKKSAPLSPHSFPVSRQVGWALPSIFKFALRESGVALYLQC